MCHHFPPPLVSLRHSQKEIIKVRVSGKGLALGSVPAARDRSGGYYCNLNRLHGAGVATGDGLRDQLPSLVAAQLGVRA